MKRVSVFLLVGMVAFVFSIEAWGQRMEICGEEWAYTDTPSNLDKKSFVIFGRVSIERPNEEQTSLKVVVRLRDGTSVKQRSFKGSGSYCFERSGGGVGGNGGEITIDINGEEVESRPLIPNQAEQREDFKIRYTSGQRAPAPPSIISAKYNYKRTGKNAKLFERSEKASADGKLEEAMEFLTAIVNDDPADYVARASLGAIYYRQKNYAEAENWFRRSVETKPDFAPAWLTLSRILFVQKKYDAAIESCKTLIKLEPGSAAAFYILGESYLRSQKANLAVEALNEAIKLDPVGMAECHLILADLYDFNGAKRLAAIEYKTFLAKVPDHRDKKVMEQYIKDNP